MKAERIRITIEERAPHGKWTITYHKSYSYRNGKGRLVQVPAHMERVISG